MIESTKQDLEETTNVRVSHRDVQREAAAAARETTLRENGLEPISAKVIVAFVVIAVIAGGVLLKDSLFNYGDHPTGYMRGADPNGGAGPPTTGEAFDVYFNHGKSKFTTCAGCHGGSGEGGSGPPIAGSAWAQDLNTHLLSIAVQGVKGPIVVKGVEYNSEMDPQAGSWNDFDLAALATYVTNTFGKDTKNITSVEQIKDLRARLEKWESEGGGQLTSEVLKTKDYFQGPLEGESIAPNALVNKKSGLPE